MYTTAEGSLPDSAQIFLPLRARISHSGVWRVWEVWEARKGKKVRKTLLSTLPLLKCTNKVLVGSLILTLCPYLLGIALEMVVIPGNTFMMGSPEGEGYDFEKPHHEVAVPPFFISKYPVTQVQWRAVVALPQVNRDLKPDPSKFTGDNRPVERVSWYDAVEFCDRLSQHTGKSYCLPSEAEWEYACRAGTTTPFHFGETITGELANYDASRTFADEPKGKNRNQTTAVGQFPPNAFGLYDMHGNVWEGCLDDWHSNYKGAPTDGSPWFNLNDNLSQKKGYAILRGGS